MVVLRRGRPLRILALASAGGHWVQLQRITPAFAGWDIAFACTDPHYGDDIPGQRYYTISDANRFTRHRLPLAALQICWIIRRERPDLIISTGAAPGLIALLLGKLVFRRRTIWIDSMANADRLSTSGRLAGRLADLWLTQWPHLAEADGPQFWGPVL